MLTYFHGNNVGNSHFIWRISEEVTNSDLVVRSQYTIETLKSKMPIYHTRAMRSQLLSKYGRISPCLKPSLLRIMYRELTGDHSSSTNEHEAEIDKRMQQLIEMEDPEIVVDLRKHNEGRKSQYDVFWDECQKHLQETVGVAVDDRRHCQVTHLAQAISANDLLEQVKAKCPEGTCIPSVSWLSLQFWPKNIHNKTKLHYTGKLDVKYMIQARQFRKDHKDAHYAAAIFRYQREMAILLRAHSTFVCMDDKHRIKVGEPGFPVAAAERGRRVLVSRNANFEVGDHDFTRFSIIPSVSLFIDIPENIEGSWYTGQVKVGLKEAAFEPSSPQRHASELQKIFEESNCSSKPVCFVYCDGGPDHRLTYVSVQASFISLFRNLDLDLLCVARTAPFHSWRNPVERIMSLLNMGLQSVGLMRKEMSTEDESIISGCNSLAALRHVAERNPHIREVCVDCIEPVKILLHDVFGRISLKGKVIEGFSAATEQDIAEFEKGLLEVDKTVTIGEKLKKASLDDHQKLKAFYNHCCQLRHYSFCIKKCGKLDCDICKPPRLPSEVFEKLAFLPDPVPQGDGHYKPFDTIYNTVTSEEHRPSLQNHPVRQKTLPFVASVQHAKNTNLMVQCEECEMWRLVYSKYKLTKAELTELSTAMNDYTLIYLRCIFIRSLSSWTIKRCGYTTFALL